MCGNVSEARIAQDGLGSGQERDRRVGYVKNRMSGFGELGSRWMDDHKGPGGEWEVDNASGE